MTFAAETDNENIEVSLLSNILTLTPSDNYNGSASVTVTVSDGILSDSDQFILTVLPINDDPFIINTIDDLEVLEGSDEIIIDLSDIFFWGGY